ncbi:MAG: type II toxin-antitoxin system VapC family toxin [Blastocatellia bacterium]
MNIYVLDTDVAGFWQKDHPTVMGYARSLPKGTPVVTTIVTFGEDLSGWLPDCRRARSGEARAKAYDRIQKGLDFYKRISCLSFIIEAAVIFDRLRKQKVRIGTNDLAIAAITLSVNAILVTRNKVDFERVPNLAIEDWTN